MTLQHIVLFSFPRELSADEAEAFITQLSRLLSLLQDG